MTKPTAREVHDTGIMLAQQGRHADAALMFQKAVMLKPDYADAWANLANSLGMIGKALGPPFTELLLFAGIRNFDTAIAAGKGQVGPVDLANYYNNRGVGWVDINQHARGMADYMKAAELNPKLPQIWSNVGNAKRHLGDIEGARDAYAKAQEVDPNYWDAAFNRALMELDLGNFEEGFKLFELRWRTGQLPPRGLPCPDWNGEDLTGKRLLFYGEQGFGDAIHFVRYATEIKAHYPGATVNIEVRLPLARLLKTVPGVDRVFAYGDELPPHDYGCAMISAARVLGTTMETIPAPIPYISADPQRVALWRARLDADLKPFGDKLRVGICWSGQARPLQPLADQTDRRRSTQLAQWEPISRVPGVVFVGLQTGEPAKQAKAPPPGMAIAHYSDELEDFADTAALMKCLDLVISVDTAVVHVAGALGMPTWMLSRFDGCWRWHGARRDSPWYPTLTQFRQPRQGDWNSVFDQVATELRGFERAAHRHLYSPIAAE